MMKEAELAAHHREELTPLGVVGDRKIKHDQDMHLDVDNVEGVRGGGERRRHGGRGAVGDLGRAHGVSAMGVGTAEVGDGSRSLGCLGRGPKV